MQETTNPDFRLVNRVLLMDKEAILELERIEAKLNELMPRLGKHKIRMLNQMVAKYYAKKFTKKSKKIAKYGTLNKGFNESELGTFFRVVDNPKYLLLFKLQASLGLRIGEAVVVNIKNLNQATRELTIYTEKARVINTLILAKPLFDETMAYYEAHKQDIEQADGYLFFADRSKSRRAEPYLDSTYVRNVFREYCKIAGLDQVYALSDETEQGRVARQLHRLTTHSLRHTAITRFSKMSNGNLVLTSRFSRHLNPNTTLTYIHSDKSELYALIEQMAK